MARRPTPDLSRDRIVDEAIALLDEDGAASLSMRRLAARLGTSTMSTYHHLADKNALIDAIAERIIGQLARPAPDAPWDEAVRAMAWSFRELTLAHPAAFRVFLIGEMPTPLLRTADDVIALLEGGGFGTDDAVLVFRTFIRYLVGSTVADQGAFGTARPDRRQASQSESQFRYGLEALIAGVGATARLQR